MGRRAIIVGCGIAGPVVAMALQRVGVEATVHEAAPRPRDDAGAFLGVAPNGAAVLDSMGLGHVLAEGHPTPTIGFYGSGGRHLATVGVPTTTIRRGALTAALRAEAEARGVPVHHGRRLETLADDGRRVRAGFADGSADEGDLLVGCDGLHARSRGLLFPQAPAPRYTGLLNLGAITPVSRGRGPAVGGLIPRGATTPDGMHMTFGERAFFGHLVADGCVYWFSNPAAGRPDALDGLTPEAVRTHLLDLHAGDPPYVRAILDAVEGQLGGPWPVYDVPNLARWHHGRTVLIGDAAHAMGPHVGQGAAMALEDAVVLARALRDLADLPSAFAAFQQERRERVQRLVRQSRRTGDRKAARSPLGRAVRDAVLPLFLRLGARDARRVHPFEPAWDVPVAAVGA